ncbi:hypothetical protein AMD27_17345 (plasmid) [Acinetobacter sp. TGL-Y2]|uniref:hypothetical protein n=1 Tax=Acinetobacter sp. TGL-Y2 TaxID=1407071 RepID=UPI0007A644CF|nr:hypothetical protein [Acinetobacter sp. TGL-Y2]AMW80682.1 hypothetical protein AMD27_17345 [Acinetobacter sp. TGL-Y2]
MEPFLFNFCKESKQLREKVNSTHGISLNRAYRVYHLDNLIDFKVNDLGEERLKDHQRFANDLHTISMNLEFANSNHIEISADAELFNFISRLDLVVNRLNQVKPTKYTAAGRAVIDVLEWRQRQRNKVALNLFFIIALILSFIYFSGKYTALNVPSLSGSFGIIGTALLGGAAAICLLTSTGHILQKDLSCFVRKDENVDIELAKQKNSYFPLPIDVSNNQYSKMMNKSLVMALFIPIFALYTMPSSKFSLIPWKSIDSWVTWVYYATTGLILIIVGKKLYPSDKNGDKTLQKSYVGLSL